jgi:hypothetical protein
MTGHKYSCKKCVAIAAKEKYKQQKIAEFDSDINGTEIDDKKEARKLKQKESYERRLNTKIDCPCGSITNLAQINKHEKTAKHQNYLKQI